MDTVVSIEGANRVNRIGWSRGDPTSAALVRTRSREVQSIRSRSSCAACVARSASGSGSPIVFEAVRFALAPQSHEGDVRSHGWRGAGGARLHRNYEGGAGRTAARRSGAAPGPVASNSAAQVVPVRMCELPRRPARSGTRHPITRSPALVIDWRVAKGWAIDWSARGSMAASRDYASMLVCYCRTWRNGKGQLGASAVRRTERRRFARYASTCFFFLFFFFFFFSDAAV